MMAAPALQSFMSHLFAEASFEPRREDGFPLVGDKIEIYDDEENRTVTGIIYQLNDIQQLIKIVQDNACIHARPAPSHPLSFHRSGSLDMSNSETRWSNDTSIEHVPAEETSIANKPRFPRRRLSVEEDTVAAAVAESTSSRGVPRYPQRKATVEFISPPASAAAGVGASHKNINKKKKAPTPPRKPQRKGTIDLSDSIDEEDEEEGSSLDPPPPTKRLVSNNNEAGTTIQNHNHYDDQGNVDINPTGSPTANTRRYSRRERVHRRARSPIPASAKDDPRPRQASGPT